jgi:hypothetical protein
MFFLSCWENQPRNYVNPCSHVMPILTNKDHIITRDSSNISKYKVEKLQRHPLPQIWKEIVHIEIHI